jgi:hypothetical protein
MSEKEKKPPRTPDSRRPGRIDELRARAFPTWKPGDRVRFAHGPGPFTIKATGDDDMVELKELPGRFAAHIFVGLDVQRFD